MSYNTDIIYETKRKILAKYPRFGGEIAGASIIYRDDLKYHTACTDGKNIYIDPNYFASLNENDRAFLLAHEIFHIKYMHMYRLKNKDGTMRDIELWNRAADAVTNANLERDGFEIPSNGINMPEAKDYSVEQFYEKLLQEKEKQNNNQDGKQGQESKQNDSQDGKQQQEGKQDDKDYQGDDHTLWEEAFAELEQSKATSKNKENTKKDDDTAKEEKVEFEEQSYFDIDEKAEFENNRKEKREKFKEKRNKAQLDIRGADEQINLGDLGESKDGIDWKILIRRELQRDETIWSQRRSIAENNYAYRLEEYDVDDEAETEIMIDVSGSVNLELVKAFLRQIKPLLEQSKLKVGCFNEKFWGMVDINSKKDIDNFTIPKEARGQSAWTEDWDLAVRSFSKKREVNKIVFTDGYPCPGTMPKQDLKHEDVVWLVYGNKKFNPCCGKVINITEKQLERLNQIEEKNDVEDRSR